MNNVLTPPFIPTPKEFKKAMLKTKLTYREYKVLDGVSSLVFEYPQERETLTITTTCRQLGELIDLPYQHVASSLKKLVSKGIITYLQKGSLKEDKNEPSIIKLNLFQEVTKSVTHTVTKSVTLTKNINKKEQQTQVKVVSSNTPSNNPPEESKEEIRKIIEEQFGKQDWEEKERLASLENPPLVGEKEEVLITPENSIIPENNSTTLTSKYNVFGREITIKPTANNIRFEPLPQEDYKKLASTASSMGIKKSLLSKGIEKLTERNCIDRKSVLENILSQIKSRINTIKNKAGYFFGLCKEIDFEEAPTVKTTSRPEYQDNGGFIPVTENFFENSSSASSSPSPVELTPDQVLKQKRKDFGQLIYDGFTIGKYKYVLSFAGVAQKIITASPDRFSYIKEGLMRHAYWNELPEKLLNECWFVGETYETETA